MRFARRDVERQRHAAVGQP